MSSWLPYLPENLANPYPMYRNMRLETPILKTPTGELVFSKYCDVKELLNRSGLTCGIRKEWLNANSPLLWENNQDVRFTIKSLQAFMLFSNGPDHKKYRSLISKFLKPSELSNSITDRVNQLVNNLNPDDDIVSNYSSILPFVVALDLLGLHQENTIRLRSSVHEFSKILEIYLSFSDLNKIESAAEYLINFFTEKVLEKQKNKDDSFMSKVIQEGKNLHFEELVSMFLSIFMAATETTSNFLGIAIYNLLRNERDIIVENRIDLKHVVDELLRYDPPAQLTVRKSLEEFNMNGNKIHKGQTLVLLIGAANHDPEIFKVPDNIVWNRTTNNHLSFSSGAHRCMGDWLGKLEIKATINAFIDKYGTSAIECETDWMPNITMRGLKKLRISKL